MAGSYRDLLVWQRSVDAVVDVYRFSTRFPRDEMFGLTSQMRRAAVSIASNIAEGQARHSKREFKHFLRNAMGSLAEVETQLQICLRLGYSTNAATQPLQRKFAEIGRMLNGLINSLPKSTD